MPTIVNTIFPVTQGFDSVPAMVAPPFSPGGGTNNEHPVGTEANLAAPGVGVTTSSPSQEKASSNPSPNPTFAQVTSPGVGVVDDSPSSDDSPGPEGPVSVSEVGVSLERTDAGEYMPQGGTVVNVVNDQIATQTFSPGQGIAPFVHGGEH